MLERDFRCIKQSYFKGMVENLQYSVASDYKISKGEGCIKRVNFQMIGNKASLDVYFVSIGCQDTASPQLKKGLLVMKKDLLKFVLEFKKIIN